MKIDHRFLDKLKENGIPDEHVHSIEMLVEKIRGRFELEMRDNPEVFSYQFRHKFAEYNMPYEITDKGRLWIREAALAKFCTKKKIAKLYETLKQLTGWEWKDPTETGNPSAAVSRWHDKVDEIATALLNVLPHKNDEDDDLDEGEEM